MVVTEIQELEKIDVEFVDESDTGSCCLEVWVGRISTKVPKAHWQ
jgi:hypothetical protein